LTDVVDPTMPSVSRLRAKPAKSNQPRIVPAWQKPEKSAIPERPTTPIGV
jgi:hypothetical protein